LDAATRTAEGGKLMYEELVKAMRETRERVKSNPGVAMFVPPYQLSEAADAIEELSAKVDSLQIFADNISKLPDCNTCLKQNRCEFVPRWGEYCRINCPAWLGTPEPPKEKT
jgi:hypothetical protein